MTANNKLLSASVIAKNEEEMIGTMIDSIQGCDEIMVVDTGSTDSTVKICKEKGAKVFRGYKWADNFSEARNVSKDKCKGEWLLIIDCDEIFEQDIDHLRRFLDSQLSDKYDAIFFSVDTGAEVNDQIRVFRNTDNIEWHGEFHNLPYIVTETGHEQIPDDRIFKSSFSIKANYSPNHERDKDRTLRIISKVLEKEPMNTRGLYYVSREWLNRQQPERAIVYLERYMKIAPHTNEYADAAYILATCYAHLGDVDRAIELCLKSASLLPSFKAPWVFLHNISHPNYKKYWKAVVDIADNKWALFVRDGADSIVD